MHIFAAGTEQAFAALVTFDEDGRPDSACCLVVGMLTTRHVHGGVEHASLLTMIPIETGAVGTPPCLMWHLRRVRATSSFRKMAAVRTPQSWYVPCKEPVTTDRYVSAVEDARPTHHPRDSDEAPCSARPFSQVPFSP